jgi:hypothetical protein
VKIGSSNFIFIERVIFLSLLCLLVTLPFSVMPTMSFVKRAGYFFSFFSLGVSIIIGIFVEIKLGGILNFKIAKKGITSLLTISVIYVTYNFYIQLNLVKGVFYQIKNRERVLIESKNMHSTDVILDPIKIDERLFTTRLLELSTDPAYIENIRLANYYKLNSVVIKLNRD